MIKAVLLDWGGVVVEGGKSFWKTVQKELGVEVSEANIADFTKLRVALNSGFISNAEFNTGLEKIVKVPVPRSVLETQDVFKIIPEMVQFIEELKSSGYKVGLLSNMDYNNANTIESLGGYSYFDPLIVSSRVHLMKPNPKVYQMAVDELKLEPAEIIFVDDLEKNLDYPKEIGMKTVLAINTDQVINDVRHLLG